MATALEILPAALDEAEAAAAWYAERSPRAAAAFVAEVDRALALVAEAPERWSAHLLGTRRIPLRRFPYLIVYRVETSRILVVAVAHGRRRPGYWRDR